MPIAKEKSKLILCQECIEAFKPTEIYTILKVDHYYFLCGPCMQANGVTGEVWKKSKTKKSKT